MNRVSDFVTIHQMQIPAANSTRPLADLPRPHWQADGLRRILFVETDARTGYLVRQAFELDSRIELKCVNASNWPFGAIEEIGAAAPDMVLLDLGPEPQLVMSLLRELRTDPWRMHLPVVLLYEFPLPSGSAPALDYAIGSIRKPVDVMRLTAQLRSLWENRPK